MSVRILTFLLASVLAASPLAAQTKPAAPKPAAMGMRPLPVPFRADLCVAWNLAVASSVADQTADRAFHEGPWLPHPARPPPTAT